MNTLKHQLIYLIISVTPLFISYLAFLTYWSEYFSSYVFEPHAIHSSMYDFIIVGAGSAGSVLANRLSANERWRVLLIEAGGAPSFITSIPALTAHLQLSPYDWQHLTVPQKNACGSMVGKKCRWPAGKMLGGSSGLNYMLHVRGSKADFDLWEEQGNPGWGYDSILHYFKKSEHSDTYNSEASEYYGEEGPLPIRTPFVTPMAEDILAMAQDNGYVAPQDINGANQTGFTIPKVIQAQGLRADGYRTYLREAKNRKNLIVMKNSRVLKLLVENGKVVGVKLSRYGKETNVFCSKEVIVSSGTVGSPSLLLLSGIGPASHLQKLGIKVVKDLPVGENLQDHLTTMLGPFMINKPISFTPDRAISPRTFIDLLMSGTGPATTVGVDAIGFLHSGLQLDNHESQKLAPDYQLMFMSSWILADYWTFIWKSFGLDGERLWEGYFKDLYYPKNMNAVSILPIILRPKSRGEVKLASSNPWDSPLIDPKYLSHPDDLNLLVKSVEQTVNMVNSSEHLLNHGFQLPNQHWPGCQDQTLFSTKYWTCYVQEMSLTMYHPVGTCKMSESDQSGVVDARLRVKDVPGLRVIDASIMPSIVSGNTNAAVVAIAEKGADMIKEDWKLNIENGMDHLNKDTKEEL